MDILIILLLASLTSINAYDRDPHRMEALVERFKFGDYYFIFYSKGANWAEAYTICQATRSRLAVVNTPERAKFLAEALSQTRTGFEDVWIGGRFAKDIWQWVPTGKPIDPPSDNFPPWLSFPTKRGKNCLSLDRKDHWYPLFVELKCNLYRPFVCEESVSGSIDKFPDAVNEVVINSRRYFLYHARATWQEALTFCKQSEARLATIPDLDTAIKLVELMKRIRPPFENVWIGAKRDILGWVWVPTDQSLANETEKSGFPPWKFDHPVDSIKSCVMLDHHVCRDPYHVHTLRQHICEEPLFIEEHCSLKRDFLCEIPLDDPTEKIKPNLITIDQKTYIFYEEPLSWIDAKSTCEEINMTLAMPETEREWETLVTHMGDMPRALYHAWLGGKWIPNQWIWLTNQSIHLPDPNNPYPPWCISIDLHEDNQDCINLDRDAHNVPLIYGFNCSIKQPFVCELNGEDFLVSDDVDPYHEYHQPGLTHFDAQWECKKNHSHLPIINNMLLAQKLALFIPRDTLVWIGGKRIDGIWRWLPTNEIIPDTEGENRYPPWENSVLAIGQAMCLAMKSGYREQPFFVERPCKEKLNYVCQLEKHELPQPDLVLDVNGIKHYFYHKGVPWNEAMFICNSGGLFLVNVGNLEMASFVMHGMKGFNPLWTSGKQLSPGSWSWITSGSKLPSTVKAGYPPWPNSGVPNDMKRGCLQLNDTENTPLFSDEDCLQNRSFVCVDKILWHNETEIEIDHVSISLHDIITSIANAKKACIESGKTVIDFTKLDNKNLLEVLKSEKIKSLWVDVIHNSAGKWIYADTQIEFQTEIDFPDRDTHPLNDPKSCLILRLTEEKLVLTPSLCDDFSRIICMAVNDSETAPPSVEKVINSSTTIIAVLDKTIYSHSILVCNDLGGEIVKESLAKTAIDFFKTIHLEYKQFWLDATYKDGAWKWTNDSPVMLEGLPDMAEVENSNGTHKIVKSCLIYDREVDKLLAANCADKYSTVCEQVVGGKCEPKIQQKYNVQWSPKCTGEPVSPGTVCRATCLSSSSLFGPEFHVCSKGKWSQIIEAKCQIDKLRGKSLELLTKTNIRTEQTQTYFLFVLDTGIKKNDFRLTLQFAKNLANTIFLSNRRRVSIELYSFNSKIIDLMEYHNCHWINTVNSLDRAPQLSNTVPNYYGAFLTAEQEFKEKEVTNGTGFIFFFAMRPDTGSMNKTIVINRLKRNGVTIIAVSVGDAVTRNQLEEIASTRYEELQLYTFKDMHGMKDASDYLRKKCKFHTRDCRMYGLAK